MLSNPNVRWFILLDSDAVINPARFHEPLLPYLKARLENEASVFFVTSDTPDLDGCSGVLLVHSRAIEYVCMWAQEVEENIYGLWDQNALWSVFEHLLANSFSELAPYTGSVRAAALGQVDKTSPPKQSDAAWKTMYLKITQEPKFLRNGPLFTLESLAPLYARQGKCGLHSSWFFHPAGSGQLCVRDDFAVKDLLSALDDGACSHEDMVHVLTKIWKASLRQTTRDAERLWQEVVKQSTSEDYLKKYVNISLQLKRNAEPQWKWKWKNKAYPRIPCLLDFEAWVSKYSLSSPEHMLTTEPSDPELEFVSPKRVTQFVHVHGKSGDLHFIPCDVNPARDFDLVVISQTLEHLYDPFKALANVFYFMRAGGYIFTSAPANNIPHMTPHHYFHYTPMGLAMLFQSIGFEVLEVGAWGNAKYEEGMSTKSTWLDYSALQNEDGLIINQANTHPDDVWLLARKP